MYPYWFFWMTLIRHQIHPTSLAASRMRAFQGNGIQRITDAIL